MSKSKIVTTAALCVLVPGVALTQQADFPIEQDANRALEMRALGEGFADLERLRVLDRQEVTLPNLGTTVKLFKVYNIETGESERVALDPSNQRLEVDELQRAEQRAAFERYGHLQPALHRLLEETDERVIPVLIKLALEEDQTINKAELPAGRELETAAREAAENSRALEQRAMAIARDLLAGYDVPARQLSVSGPFVSVSLPSAAIRELARHPRIAFIGLDQEKEILDYPTIPGSLPTTRTDLAHSAGARGQGTKIAILEGGTLNVSSACFNLDAIQDASGAASDHMTKSAGMIGNRYNNGLCNGSWQGYAPDARVLIGNVADYKDRYDWAKANGVNVVTMSWHFGSEETSGALHSRDVYFDYVAARYPWPSVFTSAGNQAGSGAFASGKGYNFFGVGNVVNDGDGDRCNDGISSSSTWKDPTSSHGDREVPEIASPGSRHDLLGSDFGGTSAATPVTASIAAVLMSKNPSLKIWPEAIRSIMTATANYQSADGANFSSFADGKDGTGMTNAYYGMLTASRRETTAQPQYRAHDYGWLGASSFSGGFFNKSWKAFTATTNSKIRITFNWNSKTTATSSVLDADLDLHILDPDGNLVAWSGSWDSSFEFVEFTPPKAGAYTIRVRGFSVPTDFSSYYGVAWTTHYDLCS